MFTCGLDGGKRDEAVAKFNEALSRIDRHTDARFAGRRTCDDTRKWAAELEDFTRVVAEQPERADGHYNRGLALWNLKLPEDRLTDPDHHDVIGQRALVMFQRRQQRRAGSAEPRSRRHPCSCAGSRKFKNCRKG